MKQKIVCFGDSITYGFPYGPESSWVSYTAKKTGLAMVNSGENGDTADDLLRRFSLDVVPHQPRYVFLLIGTNDASIEVAIGLYSQQIRKLISLIRQLGSVPLLGLPIPSSDLCLENRLSLYRDFLRTMASVEDTSFLDFAEVLSLNYEVNSKLYFDEVHPNKAGHQAMGELASLFFNNLA